jgi:hypothetical protein
MGPVWQILWIIEEDTTRDDSITEYMLSLGDDGLLKRWSMIKGLESMGKIVRKTNLAKPLKIVFCIIVCSHNEGDEIYNANPWAQREEKRVANYHFIYCLHSVLLPKK